MNWALKSAREAKLRRRIQHSWSEGGPSQLPHLEGRCLAIREPHRVRALRVEEFLPLTEPRSSLLLGLSSGRL